MTDERRNISPDRIHEALQKGGLDAVDELFYPGDGARHGARVSSYPKPEDTGRVF
jgi:hypothetical protein